jgi:hypothetical protein
MLLPVVRFLVCMWLLCFGNTDANTRSPTKAPRTRKPTKPNVESASFIRRPPQNDWTFLRYIIVPEHRILFCFIEKVACTSFNSLFNHVNNRTTTGLKDMWALNDAIAFKMTAPQVVQLVKNESWFKAVFYRDPVDRFVSAYRSKCVLKAGFSGHCWSTFGHSHASFQTAVDAVKQVKAFSNAHWLQQHQFCGDLRTYGAYFNRVELLEPHTVNLKVKGMLKAAGMQLSTDMETTIDDLFPLQQWAANKSAASSWKHGAVTNSSHTLKGLYFRHTNKGRSRLAALVEHYLVDYTYFNMSLRPWQLDLLKGNDSKYNGLIARLSSSPTVGAV